MSSIIQKIQSVGSTTNGSDLFNIGTDIQYSPVFVGNNYYVIGDGGTPYEPLPINVPRTYIALYKITAEVFANFIYSTHEVTGYKGESIYSFNGKTRGFMSSLGVSMYNESDINTSNLKWHSLTNYYNGSGTFFNSPQYNNGRRQKTLLGSGTITQSTNTLSLGYLGTDKYSNNGVNNNNFTGNIAIFSIYKGLLTPAQQLEFSINPFGFLADLRVSNPNDFYLDLKFNENSNGLVLDASPNSFPITPVGASTFSQFP